jgi:hypothetical protein
LVANYIFLPLFPLNPTFIALGAVLMALGLAHLFIRMESTSSAGAAATEAAL